MTTVRDAKDLKKLISEKSSRYMVAVTVFDEQEKQLHSSVYTKDFPVGDMSQSLKDVSKLVENVYHSEVRMAQKPNDAQSEHTQNLIK